MNQNITNFDLKQKHICKLYKTLYFNGFREGNNPMKYWKILVI